MLLCSKNYALTMQKHSFHALKALILHLKSIAITFCSLFLYLLIGYSYSKEKETCIMLCLQSLTTIL